MSDRAAELGAALQNAAAVPAILDALARGVWFNAHAGAECPDARIPSHEALAAWPAPVPAVQEAVALAVAAVGAVPPMELAIAVADEREPLPGIHGGMALYFVWLPVRTVRPDLARTPQPGDPYGPLVDIHAAWCAADPPRRHPLAPLVAAWQARQVPADWDERQHANLPAPLARTRYVVPVRELRDGQAALPVDWDAHPPPPVEAPRFEVGYLPTLAPEPSMLPLALLDVFSAAASRGRGGPVPVPARIGWEVIVALNGDDRERVGGPALLDCTLMDLHRMVYPSTSSRIAATL